MKRILLTLAVLALTATSADAGPLRNLAGRVKARVQQVGQRTRAVVHRVVDAPFKVAAAKPVRSAMFGTCSGGVCK